MLSLPALLFQSAPPPPASGAATADLIAIAGDAAAALESLATVAALIIGGIWTFRAFIRGRGNHPRAAIEHQAAHRLLPNGAQLLILDVFIANAGQASVQLRKAETWVQQILPLPAHVQSRIAAGQDIAEDGKNEGDWNLLGTVHEQHFPEGEYVIDPGERDQFRHNFLLPPHVRTIQIYTYLEPVTEGIGWKLKTTYDLTDQARMIAVTEQAAHRVAGGTTAGA